MIDRPQHPDPFEEELATSLERYAAEVGGKGDAYAIADAMLEVRGRRRLRIGLGAIAGGVATAILAVIAIGALAEPQRQVGPASTESPRATDFLQPTDRSTPWPEPSLEGLPGVEAPEACGFPDGTALSYAGRSTTAELDVQEVVGDPMSFEPADIYVTSDRVDHGGWGPVRLVCAIYQDPGNFTEITVHPEDGGRFSAAPSSSAFDTTCSLSPSPVAGSGDGPIRVSATELWEAGQCGDALARYGGSDLILVAYPSPVGAPSPCRPLEPSWFTFCEVGLFLRAPDAPEDESGLGPTASALLHPDLGAISDIWDELWPEPATPTLIQFTAHFDDPAASDCRAAPWPEGSELPLPTRAEIVEGCRTTLVITAFETVEP